jgi:hypothetical protein
MFSWSMTGWKLIPRCFFRSSPRRNSRRGASCHTCPKGQHVPIEMPCPGCGQTLRVADEHAGRLARCPACATVVTVPVSSPPASPPPLFPEPREPSPPAPEVRQPEVNPYASPTAPRQPSPFGTGSSGQGYPRPHRGGMVLAFGIVGLICLPLTFLGCCLPFGLLLVPFSVSAWVVGAGDLRAMRDGQMDPNGQGMTQAGMILGVIGTGLAGLGLLFSLGVIVLSIVG